MSRVLIAILGCVQYARRGFHQAQRDTWLRDVAGFPGLEYRFFLGNGSLSEGDDEAAIQASPGGYDRNRGVDYGEKCRWATEISSKETPYSPLADEVLLPCPDDYIHLTAKLRQIICWALEQGFDFLFRCDTDTYADVGRLMYSGFEDYDFFGHPSTAEGAGYFLSKRSMNALAAQSVNTFADGTWVTVGLKAYGIQIHGDLRFSDEEVGKDNQLVSTHVGFKAGYEPKRMYGLHERYARP